MKQIVVMSIKPKYAWRIFCGEKFYEFRRKRPRFSSGTIILVYSPRPETRLIGHFTLKNIISDTIEKLWAIVRNKAGIEPEEYFSYFEGSGHAHALEITNPILWEKQVSLWEIRKQYPNYNPPQSYHYLSPDHPLMTLARERERNLIELT